MTGMTRGRRPAGTSAAVLASLAGVAVLASLSACTTPSTPAPAASSTPASTTWDPGDIPDPSAALQVPPAQRGDCPVDPAAAGVIAFVVTSDDDVTPIELTYPVFRTDGTELVRRMTQPGPVITVLQSDCTDGIVDGPWGFVATADAGSLACALFYGGKLVASDSAFNEGGASDGTDASDGRVRADCTGHPGM